MSTTKTQGTYYAREHSDILLSEWQDGIPPGLSTGFDNLETLYKVKKKQWTVVSGMPSSGKSTFVDNLMINLSKQHGWKHLVCSPENQPIHRHIETLIEIYSGKMFSSPELNQEYADYCLTYDELKEAMRFIDEHFYFICPDETDFNIDYILSLAEQIKHEDFDFDGFLLDPYNELEHKRPPGFTETEYISQLLSKVRRFVRAQNIHQWFVAHPTKQTQAKINLADKNELTDRKLYQRTSLYDISGGAHWYNKCDNGIIVYRNYHLEEQTTTVAVDKIRFKECGTPGQTDFKFIKFCNRLKPVEVY